MFYTWFYSQCVTSGVITIGLETRQRVLTSIHRAFGRDWLDNRLTHTHISSLKSSLKWPIKTHANDTPPPILS